MSSPEQNYFSRYAMRYPVFLEASLLFILIIKLSKVVRKKIKTIDSYINSARVEIGTIQNSSEKSVINQ